VRPGATRSAAVTLRHETAGPQGDAARHRSLAALEAGLRALAPPPADVGRLVLIVRRRADGLRETPSQAVLTPGDGVPGDAWTRRPPCDPESQLAVMRHDVAALVANGQSLTLFGDNLLVDLDISTDNLPAGSRLRVGDALVVTTAKPHNGCVKFRGRFGKDALRFVNQAKTRPQNLRGVYWKVVEAGVAVVGSPVRVLSRASV
jgi:MOSC domain-containing protein YiiM